MNESVQRWQQDARRAFDWITSMYEQVEVAWQDANRFFTDDGWDWKYGGGWGGAAMSNSDLSDWPFIYMKALGALPRDADWKVATGRVAVLGFLLFDGKRPGPVCFGGVAEWSVADASIDHWTLCAALGVSDSYWFDGQFDVGTGPIHTSTPTTKGRQKRKGVERVRWFEVPLGALSSPDELRAMVDAVKALHGGDDGPAMELVTRHG